MLYAFVTGEIKMTISVTDIPIFVNVSHNIVDKLPSQETLRRNANSHAYFINNMNYYTVVDIFKKILDTVNSAERQFTHAEISRTNQLRWFIKAINESGIADASIYVRGIPVLYMDSPDDFIMKKICDLEFDDFIKIYSALVMNERHYYGKTVSMAVPEYFEWRGL